MGKETGTGTAKALALELEYMQKGSRNWEKQRIRIDRWYPSSQTCSVCGYKNTEIKDLRVREWECPRCKSHHDRDLNAAINIRKEGMRIISI